MFESIQNLISAFESHGAVRFYAKKLAPNDNSKNQLYLGGDFSVLNIIPYKDITVDKSPASGARKDHRAKAKVNFFWIDKDGKHHAPNTQLILYPKYPEVRMSGFLRGCKSAPSKIMTCRGVGRVLFFGITRNGDVLGFVVDSGDTLAKELSAKNGLMENGVFLEISNNIDAKDSKHHLLAELNRIYEKQWIDSKKYSLDGIKPYKARNGGGYTLEAELGITANSYAEPDFMGWEVKQYSVRDFNKYAPKSPVTLMTPEPTGGIYKDNGVEDFMHRFSYPDKSGKENRFNFGGIYSTKHSHHKDTGLCHSLLGYDNNTQKITDMDGGIVLLSQEQEIAAIWNFSEMLQHWNRKHAHAAYVPSLFKTPPPQYSYACKILMAEQTDFDLFLKAVSSGVVYYDPAIKLENSGSKNQKIKRRSQFRIKHKDLVQMYHKHEWVRFGGCI